MPADRFNSVQTSNALTITSTLAVVQYILRQLCSKTTVRKPFLKICSIEPVCITEISNINCLDCADICQILAKKANLPVATFHHVGNFDAISVISKTPRLIPQQAYIVLLNGFESAA